MALADKIKQLKAGIKEAFRPVQGEIIVFDYNIPKYGLSNLDSVVEEAQKFRAAKEAILADNKLAEVSYGIIAEQNFYNIDIRCPDTNSLTSAFDRFIQTAGIPSLVEFNFDVAEAVLEKYNKKLKRKWEAGSVGKHVVDKY